MIDLNLILTFIEVAKTKNLRLAARDMAVSQPALSQRIKALEDQVGKSLFLRRAGMELNSTGKEFYLICEDYAKNIELIDGWVHAQKGAVAGTVCITTTYGPVGYIFPNFLKSFLNKYRDIRVHCTSVNTTPMVEDEVLSGKTELGMIVGPCQKPSLKTQILLKNNKLLMVCSPDYPLAKKKKISKDNLCQARILVHSGKDSRTQRNIFKQLKMEPSEFSDILRLPDMESCKTHALIGVGASFVANLYVYKDIKAGKLVALPGFTMNPAINLISRNEKYISPAVTIFKNEFVKYCRKLDEELAVSY